MNDYMIYIDDSIILGTCISIIISTLALTVPLLLQMMSRINTQYNSVVLIDFFIKEKHFKFLKNLLIISILTLFLWVFTHFYQYNCIYEIVSYILIIVTILLVISLSLVIKLCINYNSPAALFHQISKQHKNKSKRKAVENFSYKKIEVETKYIDAYISLFKYAVKNDIHLVNRIAQYTSTIFNSYRNTYYQYVFPKTGNRCIEYPQSYYSLISNLESWLLANNHEKVYSPYLLLTWLYDTDKHQTYLSISTINCIWKNLVSYVQHENTNLLTKYLHHLFLWSNKWSILYKNNKYDYQDNSQYQQECDNIRVLVLGLQVLLLKNKKEHILKELWDKYNDQGTLGKYSALFFPKTIEDLLDAYSLLVTIFNKNEGLSLVFVDGSLFQNHQDLMNALIEYIAYRFCIIYPTFGEFHIKNLKFKNPLFISFPKGSIYKYMNTLKETIIHYKKYDNLETLFELVSNKIHQSNVSIIMLASFNQQMLLNYFATIQGSIKQLYSHTLLYCDTKNRKNKSRVVSIPIISRKESKRYFIDIDYIAGNAYFRHFSNKLQTNIENIVFTSVANSLSAEKIYYAKNNQIADVIRQIIKQHALKKDVILINSFIDLSQIPKFELIQPKRTNKIVPKDKYRLDKIDIVDIPISQSFREGSTSSIYIIKKSDAPYMNIFNPMQDQLELDNWICANEEQQIYLRLGKTYNNGENPVNVEIEMKIGVEFYINPEAEVWKVVLEKD